MLATPFPAMRVLAHRLLALEAANQTVPDAHLPEAPRVLEKLRLSLIRFAGLDGFNALARRALALARAEVPALQTVSVGPDGRLEGLEGLFADGGDAGVEAALAVTTQLLALLITFVGEPLMLRLVHDAWPAVLLDA
jgi:hypothetical protein